MSMDDIRRVLHMVAELHRLGYERLRLVPMISPSGLHWRGSVTPVSNVRRKHGARARAYSDEVLAIHSTGQGAAVFEWEDARDDPPEALARKFIERFPGIASAGKGSDPAYADWYRQMLELTAPEGTFYADGDWVVADDQVPTLSVPQGVVVPLPPPGEAD
jgi:hypothetical protein